MKIHEKIKKAREMPNPCIDVPSSYKIYARFFDVQYALGRD